MGFGRPRAPSSFERGRGAQRAGARLSILALASALSLASCLPWGGGRGAAFSSALVGLDVLIAADKSIAGPLGAAQKRELDQAFARARKNARSVPEWLSVLRRAKASEAEGDVGRFASTADLARKAHPGQHRVGLSCIDEGVGRRGRKRTLPTRADSFGRGRFQHVLVDQNRRGDAFV